MSYTPEQLKEMAEEVIKDRDEDGIRSFDLMIRLAARLVQTPMEVWNKIMELAK